MLSNHMVVNIDPPRCGVIMRVGPRSGQPCGKIEARHCPAKGGWHDTPENGLHRRGCVARAMVHHAFEEAKEVECPNSPSGFHEFSPDWEYDETGQTENCEYCGEAPNG